MQTPVDPRFARYSGTTFGVPDPTPFWPLTWAESLFALTIGCLFAWGILLTLERRRLVKRNAELQKLTDDLLSRAIRH